MALTQNIGQLRSPVATYAVLPVTGNVLGDLRITSDVGSLYTWMNANSSGSLSDWKKVTVSSYADLKNRPISAPLAIDDATQSIRNIYLNYVLLFYMSIVSISTNIMKMFEGVLDSFLTNDGIDGSKTSGNKKLTVATGNVAVNYEKNNFDGSLDSYTKLLIHGRNFNGSLFFPSNGRLGGGGGGGDMGGTPQYVSFLDDLYNDIIPENVLGDVSITKFGTKSFLFGGTTDSFLSVYYLNPDGDCFKVNGVDFTWDFWVRPNTNNAETILVNHCFNHAEGDSFTIEKLANKTVKVSIKGANNYTYDNQWIPVDPVSYNVTSVNTIEQNTWAHIALVRSNGYLKLFINGNLEATSSVADTQNIVNYKQDMGFPYYDGSPSIKFGYGFNGRMEEIRFSKGIARWISNFTVPTVAYNTPIQSVPCNNMVIQSNGYQANAIPTSARVVVFIQKAIKSFDPTIVEAVTPNTDIKVYVSRDGGTTFTQASDLKIEFDVYQQDVWGSIYTNIDFLVGTVDISNQPSGKEMVYKITTHNNKDILIRSVSMNWK